MLLKHILQDKADEKYYISERALNRIIKKSDGEFGALINPEKTGTLNTKNNSGQLSVDNGTTLISENGIGKSLRNYTDGKTPPLRSHAGCGHDNFIMGVVNDNSTLREILKGMAIDANYFKGMDNHAQRTMIKECIGNIFDNGHDSSPGRVYTVGGKASSINASDGGNSSTGLYLFNNRIRRLTPVECCRLQTVPDDYFFDAEGRQIVSDTQIYKMLGNGWTVDVIVHIFSYLPFINKLC